MSTPVEIAIGGEGLSALARAVTSRGLPFRFEAKGGSMSPFLRDGDVLTIYPLTGPLRLGEVAAFCHPATGRLMVHRVIGIAGRRILTRGDAVRGPDGWFPVECVLGRVVSAVRVGRACHFGLGPERVPVALLSRAGFLVPLLYPGRKLYRCLKAVR